jgi:hypothetical protein
MLDLAPTSGPDISGFDKPPPDYEAAALRAATQTQTSAEPERMTRFIPPQPNILPAPEMQAVTEGAAMGLLPGGAGALRTAAQMFTGTKAAELAQPGIEKLIPGEGTWSQIGRGVLEQGAFLAPGLAEAGVGAMLRRRNLPPAPAPAPAPAPREPPVPTEPFQAAAPAELAPGWLEAGQRPTATEALQAIRAQPALSGLPQRPPGFEAPFPPPEAPRIAEPGPIEGGTAAQIPGLVARFPGPENTEARVIRTTDSAGKPTGEFTVTVADLDSGRTLPEMRRFPNQADAEASARTIQRGMAPPPSPPDLPQRPGGGAMAVERATSPVEPRSLPEQPVVSPEPQTSQLSPEAAAPAAGMPAADLGSLAGADEANRAMRRAGRTEWSAEDYNTAVREHDRINPPPVEAAPGIAATMKKGRKPKVAKPVEAPTAEEPEIAWRQRAIGGGPDYEFRVGRNEFNNYRIEVRTAGTNEPWESAYEATGGAPEALIDRMGERIARQEGFGRGVQPEDILSPRLRAAVETEQARMAERSAAEAERRAAEAASYQRQQEYRANLQEQFKGVKFKQAKVDVPMFKEGEPTGPATIKGPSIGGLIVHKVSAPGTPAEYQISHVASGKRVMGEFSTQEQARVAAWRLGQMIDFTKPEAEVMAESAKKPEFRELYGTVRADVWGEPAPPPPPAAKKVRKGKATVADILKSEKGAAVVPGAQTAEKVAGALKEDAAFLAKWFDPIGFASDETLNTLVGRKGADIEAARFQYNQASKGNEATFDRMIGAGGKQAAYDYLGRMSTGRKQSTPELQRLADFHRQALDAAALSVAEVRGDFPYLENYVPGIWKDPANAERVLMTRGRRPLEGSKNFLRKKFYRDFEDGIAAGLEPVTDNPETLVRTYLEDVRKFVYAQHVSQDGIEAGRWQWVPGTGQAPEGKAFLDDAVARRYFPRNQVPLIIPEGNLRDTLSQFAEVVRTERATQGPARTTRTVETTGGTGPPNVPAGKIEDRVYEALTARGFSEGEARQFIDRLKAAGAKATPEASAEAQTTVIKEITEKIRTILRTEATELHLPPEVRTLGRTAMGPTLAGRWAVDEGEARLLNNYLSRNKMMERPTVRAVMRANASLNGLQLGLSGFHAVGDVVFNPVASHAGLAMGRLARGDWVGAAKRALETPIAPYRYLREGVKAWNDPALVEAALGPLKAGAQLARPTGAFGTGSVWDAFLANMRRKEYGAAITKAPMAAIDGMMKPLFEHVIPRVKVGAYLDLMADELERNAGDIAAGKISQQTVARDAWKNIENRFGKINYDNLFWNRTFQSSMQLMWRAVGWNHGTLRELGGAALQDTPQAIKGLLTGQGGQFTPKMQYLAGLTFTVASAGALYQYLHTGEAPQQLKDYFFPRNGQRDADGNEIRVRFPTYFKDIYGITDIKGTIVNKLSPVLNLAVNLWQNRDFFGDYIWNPNDVLPTKVKQVAEHMMTEMQPFSVQQYRRLAEGKASLPAHLEAFAGITKAPRAVITSPLQKEIQGRLQDIHGARGPRTPEQKTLDQLKVKAREGVKAGDTEALKAWVVEAAKQERPVTVQTLSNLLKSSGKTSIQRQFEALPKADRERLVQEFAQP